MTYSYPAASLVSTRMMGMMGHLHGDLPLTLSPEWKKPIIHSFYLWMGNDNNKSNYCAPCV